MLLVALTLQVLALLLLVMLAPDQCSRLRRLPGSLPPQWMLLLLLAQLQSALLLTLRRLRSLLPVRCLPLHHRAVCCLLLLELRPSSPSSPCPPQRYHQGEEPRQQVTGPLASLTLMPHPCA